MQYKITPKLLEKFFNELHSQFGIIYGPKLLQGAVQLDQLDCFADLPVGMVDQQEAGQYRVVKTDRNTFFEYAVGPHSIKKFLHPSRRKLWRSYREEEGGLRFEGAEIPAKPFVLFGMRSCDVQAMITLDRVFIDQEHSDQFYKIQRSEAFLVTATCRKPSKVCFCTSMGHGPQPSLFDINLTEVYEEGVHFFVVEAGSEKGQKFIDRLDLPKVDSIEGAKAVEVIERSINDVTKNLDTKGLPEYLADNLKHPHWDDVADRCLSCGNCTMVCPTCFCSTTYDVNDLEGQHSERWLRWDSCFTGEYSYIHGGQVRDETKSRYRQWLTHKLSSWHKQFGSSGCVGCGRCIAWCPVGIDITEEVKAMRGKYEDNS